MSNYLQLNDALPQLLGLAESFREVGAQSDREGVAPIASLQALQTQGLLHVTHSQGLGGPDGSLKGAQPELFLYMLRTLCRADSATGHCFQLHNHALWQLETIGTPEQIELFVKPALEKFSIFSAVGSEPGRVNMYEMKTRAVRVDGGWLVNGVKNFVTNGTIADLIITSVALDGVEGYLDNLQMMLIRPDMPGVSWDDAWYQPHGMRAARSPIMRLENVFVPDNHLLGEPGAFARQRWQGRFHLGFAANYLGTTEGLFDWYLDYQRGRNKGNDPYTQLRVGEVKMQIDAAAALFDRAVQSWRGNDVVHAELISMSAKSTAARSAFSALQSVLLSAGATAQFEEHPLGRTARNIETFVVHAGHDRTAQIIGQAQLGATFDSTLQR
jgi:alkylation response protein AidB-like acyl-CoA dehydrogenase